MTKVSGPDGVFRLENKEGKVIYIFGEFHNSLNYQNECPISDDSVRIDQLLKKAFKKNKKVGFFLETHPSFSVSYENTTYLRSYIHSLRTLFNDNFFREGKKIKKSKKYPNVMFHFFDIRGEGCLNDIYQLYEVNITLSNCISVLLEIRNLLNCVLYDRTVYSAKKIVNKKYNNTKIKNAIFEVYNQVFDKLKDLEKEVPKVHKECLSKFDMYHKSKYTMTDNEKENLTSFCTKAVEKIKDDFTSYLVFLCDLYLLRRLLDKDYGTNINFIYCGFYHAVNITLFLMKYTDYALIKSTSFNPVLEKVYEKYNVEWYLDNIQHLSTNILGVDPYYEEVSQCVDLSNFPKDLQ